jgi:hypothetical protein
MPFNAGTFPHDFLKIDTVNCRTSMDFTGAIGHDGWPNLEVLPERVLPAWNGKLLGVDVMSLQDGADAIYGYESFSEDSLTSGRPVGITIENGTYKCVNLSFPLWTMPTDSADLAFHRAMEFLGEPISIGGNEGESSPLPEMTLLPNYPNPFNASTTLSFYLPSEGEYRLEIYNLLGQKTAILASGDQESGWHNIIWDAAGKTSGVYFAKLTGDKREITRKIILLK